MYSITDVITAMKIESYEDVLFVRKFLDEGRIVIVTAADEDTIHKEV